MTNPIHEQLYRLFLNAITAIFYTPHDLKRCKSWIHRVAIHVIHCKNYQSYIKYVPGDPEYNARAVAAYTAICEQVYLRGRELLARHNDLHLIPEFNAAANMLLEEAKKALREQGHP